MTKVNKNAVKEVNRTKFSKEKTEELLKNLKDSGEIVGVEDLAHYIRQSGVIVKESIGRKRLVFELNPTFYGVDMLKKGESMQGFHKNHVKTGAILFIPKDEEKVLANLESSIRMLRRRASIGYDDRFMTLDAYKEFKTEFDDRKTRYFELRDKIAGKWDALRMNFQQELTNWLKEFNAQDREVLFRTIMARVPTVEEYKSSFYMNLKINAFPVAENLDMFRDDIRDQIQEGLSDETVETMYGIIGKTLGEAFESINASLKTYRESQVLSSRTKGSFARTAKQLAQKNIFANSVINDVKEMISKMATSDSVEEDGELILGTIFGYSKELGIDGDVQIAGCHLDEDELNMYYDEYLDSKNEVEENKEDEENEVEVLAS